MSQHAGTIFKKVSLVLKTVAARSLFVSYGILAVWRVTVTTGNKSYWFLLMTLVPVVMELMYISVYRNFKPFKWINPEVAFYLMCVIPCIWITELTLLEQSHESGMTDVSHHQGQTISTPISFGNITNHTMIRSSRIFVYLVLSLFSLSLLQFTLVLTATRKLPLPKAQLDGLDKVVDFLKYTEKTSTKSKIAMWLDIVQNKEKVNVSRQSTKSSPRVSSPKKVIDTIIEAEERESLASEPHYILFEDEPANVDVNQKKSVASSASNFPTECKIPDTIQSVKTKSVLNPVAGKVSTSNNRPNKAAFFTSNIDSKERSIFSKILLHVVDFIDRVVASDSEKDSYSDATGIGSDNYYLDTLDVKDNNKPAKRDHEVRPKFMSLQEAGFYLKKLSQLEKNIDSSTADASSCGPTSAGSKNTDRNGEHNFRVSSEHGVKKKTKKRTKKKKDKPKTVFISYPKNKFNLFCFYNEIWSIIVQLLLQDVPFFVLRVFVLLYYRTPTRFIILFTFKNFITTTLGLRRVKALYAEDKEPWLELMKYTQSSKRKTMDNSKKTNV